MQRVPGRPQLLLFSKVEAKGARPPERASIRGPAVMSRGEGCGGGRGGSVVGADGACCGRGREEVARGERRPPRAAVVVAVAVRRRRGGEADDLGELLELRRDVGFFGGRQGWAVVLDADVVVVVVVVVVVIVVVRGGGGGDGGGGGVGGVDVAVVAAVHGRVGGRLYVAGAGVESCGRERDATTHKG